MLPAKWTLHDEPFRRWVSVVANPVLYQNAKINHPARTNGHAKYDCAINLTVTAILDDAVGVLVV